jgi:hypothetical protein
MAISTPGGIEFEIVVHRHSTRSTRFKVLVSGVPDEAGAQALAKQRAEALAVNTDYSAFSESGVAYEPEVIKVTNILPSEPVTLKPVTGLLNFTVGPYEDSLIMGIARRAHELGTGSSFKYDGIPPATIAEWWMDICGCHNNGCPLRLAELLAAPHAEFIHDVVGIRKAINRSTGRLEGIFHPRYALPVRVT